MKKYPEDRKTNRCGLLLVVRQQATDSGRLLNNFWFKSFQVVKPFQMQYLEYIFPKMCFKNSYWIVVGMEPFSIPSTPSLQASNSLQSHLAAILKLSSRHCRWRSHRRRSSHLASISRLTLLGSMFFGTVIVPLKPGFLGIRSSNVGQARPWAYSARRHHRDTLGYSHTWKSRGDELLISWFGCTSANLE